MRLEQCSRGWAPLDPHQRSWGDLWVGALLLQRRHLLLHHHDGDSRFDGHRRCLHRHLRLHLLHRRHRPCAFHSHRHRPRHLIFFRGLCVCHCVGGRPHPPRSHPHALPLLGETSTRRMELVFSILP